MCGDCYRKSTGQYYDPVKARELTLSGQVLEFDHYVYILADSNKLSSTDDLDFPVPMKIGRTRNYKQRFNDISKHSPVSLGLVILVPVERGYNLESELHKMFREKRIHGEWFELCRNDLIMVMNLFSSDMEWGKEKSEQNQSD